MIKKTRSLKGFTQAVLAEKLSISLRHMQRLENEKKRPSISLLIKLIIILDWSSENIIEYLKELP